MNDDMGLEKIWVNQKIFGGKPINLGMPAAGDSPEAGLKAYPWLEPEDIKACLV